MGGGPVVVVADGRAADLPQVTRRLLGWRLAQLTMGGGIAVALVGLAVVGLLLELAAGWVLRDAHASYGSDGGGDQFVGVASVLLVVSLWQGMVVAFLGLCRRQLSSGAARVSLAVAAGAVVVLVAAGWVLLAWVIAQGDSCIGSCSSPGF